MATIGKDLERIRMAEGLTIEDMHHATKISVAILESIENGSIFEDKTVANTYVRSYVRSYGRALKIDDSLLIKALDQQETGNYNQLLLEEYLPESKKATTRNFTLDSEQTEKPSHSGKEAEKEEKTVKPEKNKNPQSLKPEADKQMKKGGNQKQDSLSSDKKGSVAATVIEDKDVDWANMGHKFQPVQKRAPFWPFLIILLLIAAGVASYFLFFKGNQLAESDSENSSIQQFEEPSEQSSPQGADLLPAPLPLNEILYITIYAAYGELGPVRVWSDLKPRLDPYWIETGTAMTFEFEDLIRIRGQYQNLLLFKNGHLIQDPVANHFNQSENSIELTRELFSAESRWAETVAMELPDNVAAPDTILSRPVFN